MNKGMQVKGEALAGVTLFADLDLERRQAIADQSVLCSFAAGDTIVSHKDESREVFFIISGDVEISMYSLNGKRVAFLDKGPGDMVGELAAIDGQPRCAHVIAKTACKAASIEPDIFMSILADNPDLTRKVLTRLATEVRSLSERVFEFSALRVNNRIHVELLRLARQADGAGARRTIEDAPTHADIASRVSSHREAITRELNRLVKDGLLEKSGDALVVTDIDRLAALVEESLGDVPAD